MGFYSGGAVHWFLQRVSGAVLLVLLIIHFWVTHYFPGGVLSYQNVATRLSQPGWKLLYLVFLVLCIYHGLNGLWIILQDYVRKDGLRLFVFGALIIVSLFLLSLGMLTIIPFSAGM